MQPNYEKNHDPISQATQSEVAALPSTQKPKILTPQQMETNRLFVEKMKQKQADSQRNTEEKVEKMSPQEKKDYDIGCEILRKRMNNDPLSDAEMKWQEDKAKGKLKK